MTWNGSGTFSPARNFVADKAAGAPTNIVTASLVDEVITDLADGLEHCQTVNGETTITANLPMSTFRHTGVGNAQARTDYASAAQIEDGALQYAGTSAGTDTITASVTPAITAYVAGQRFSFKAGGTNTGAATINFNSVGAIAVQKLGAALVAGDITADDIVEGEIRDVSATKTFQITSPLRTPVLTAGSIPVASLGQGVVLQGKHTIWLPAAAWKPTVTAGCAILASRETTAGRPDINWLLFDATSDEHAQCSVRMPKSWDGGTLTFEVDWSSTATDTDGVAWALQAVAVGDSDTFDTNFGTAVVVTDDNQSAAEERLRTAVSAALTVGGTPAGEKLVCFDIFRDVSDANDDMTEDAGLIGVTIFYTINAGTDA